jgi:hypothetical protein
VKFARAVVPQNGQKNVGTSFLPVGIKTKKLNITAPGQWAYFARVINSFRANWYGVADI